MARNEICCEPDVGIAFNGTGGAISPRLAHGCGLPRYRLQRVLDQIRDDLTGDLSVARLAGIAGMSPHYFTEMFRRSTGSPPHQFVLSQRIECAKARLRDPKYSVIEAGLDAGFRNPSHFARAFRKLTGVTPSAFQAAPEEVGVR